MFSWFRSIYTLLLRLSLALRWWTVSSGSNTKVSYTQVSTLAKMGFYGKMLCDWGCKVSWREKVGLTSVYDFATTADTARLCGE